MTYRQHVAQRDRRNREHDLRTYIPMPHVPAPASNPYDLCAWVKTGGVQVRRVFEQTQAGGVSPEQRAAVIQWLDAHRRGIPAETRFEGGVDIRDGNGWIPFTDLNGCDMWSGKVRV